MEKILGRMKLTPQNIRYQELVKVCDYYFGQPRQAGTSHRVYKLPWSGDPRVNIQNVKGMAKPYQVRQVLAAIEKLQGGSES